MAKDYNVLIENWLEDCKARYLNDTMEEALLEGRVAIRTFDKESLREDLNLRYGKSEVGKQGLKALAEKLENPSQSPQSLSFSILPSKPFGSNMGRIGILTTLPFQEDIQKYKKYTNKDFVERNNIDPDLVKETKEYLTRVSYFEKDDVYADYEKTDARHYRPNFKYKDKGELQENAHNYQNLAKHSEFHDPTTYNEALVKVRDSSKLCLTAFNMEDLQELLKKNAKEILPNSKEVQYALFESQTNNIKFVDEKHYNNTGNIEFSHQINASHVNPKPLPQQEIKSIASKLQESVNFKKGEPLGNNTFILPPINKTSTSKLNAKNIKDNKPVKKKMGEERLKNLLPKIKSKEGKGFNR